MSVHLPPTSHSSSRMQMSVQGQCGALWHVSKGVPLPIRLSFTDHMGWESSLLSTYIALHPITKELNQVWLPRVTQTMRVPVIYTQTLYLPSLLLASQCGHCFTHRCILNRDQQIVLNEFNVYSMNRYRKFGM